MKKLLSVILAVAASSLLLFAGDVANLVNLGFSPDGMTYAFGEYGITDQTYRSYAEIYIVDVAKNDFVKSGIFKTSPSALTANKDSKSVFLALQNRAGNALSKNRIADKNAGRPVYAQSEKTKEHTNFTFRDFETNYEYTVVLHKAMKDGNAAFHLSIDVIALDGSKKTYTLGNKNFFRPGVKDYNIKRILINNANSALVFIVEKIVRDKSGDCVRYMVETIKL